MTLTRIPSAASTLVARRPSRMSGTFTTILLCIFASSRPSLIMASDLVPTTSALIGPFTRLQISKSTSLKLRPSFATSEGFVVTRRSDRGSLLLQSPLYSPYRDRVSCKCPSTVRGASSGPLKPSTLPNGGPRRWRYKHGDGRSAAANVVPCMLSGNARERCFGSASTIIYSLSYVGM